MLGRRPSSRPVHNLRGELTLPHRFHEIEGRGSHRRVRLTADLHAVTAAADDLLDLELAARWSIVENSFPSTLVSSHPRGPASSIVRPTSSASSRYFLLWYWPRREVSLPDGRTLLATGSYGGSVRLWNPDGAVEAIRLVPGTRITAITAITTGADSGLAIAGTARAPSAAEVLAGASWCANSKTAEPAQHLRVTGVGKVLSSYSVVSSWCASQPVHRRDETGFACGVGQLWVSTTAKRAKPGH